MSVDTLHLHGTTDAQVWAQTFAEVRAARLAEDGQDIASDEGTMAGWFANAFMAQYDASRAALAEHRPYDDSKAGIQRCFTCASTDTYPNGVAVHEPWPCLTVVALTGGLAPNQPSAIAQNADSGTMPDTA